MPVGIRHSGQAGRQLIGELTEDVHGSPFAFGRGIAVVLRQAHQAQ